MSEIVNTNVTKTLWQPLGPHTPREQPSVISMTILSHTIQHVYGELDDLFRPLFNLGAVTDPHYHRERLMFLSHTLPAGLQPTQLQLAVPHYFGVDLIPFPSLRDCLILAGSLVSYEFVADVLSFMHGVTDMGHIQIWGNDWLNESTWEFSHFALSKWTHVLGPEWWERTNFWRQQRGLPAVSLQGSILTPGYVHMAHTNSIGH